MSWRSGALVLLLSTVVHAEPCSTAQGPWVQLALADGFRDAAFRAQLEQQFRAGLAQRGIGLCARGVGAPAARVEIAAAGAGGAQIVVGAEDAVTDKRVSRQVDLSSLPEDAWPLALAVAADEILRASWAELVLDTESARRSRQRGAPTPVLETARESVAPELASEPRGWFLGACGVVEAYSAGQLLIGADARAGAPLVSALELELSFGLRSAPRDSAEHGSVRASALSLGVGPRWRLSSPGAALGAALFGRAELSRIEYNAVAGSSARADSGTATAWLGKLGASGWLAPEPQLRLFAELAASVPVRGAAATDDGEVISGVDGLGAAFSLGVAGVL